MKILVSNDDGFQASGINFLREALIKDYDVTVIAPHTERSSCGHGITLGEPIRVKQERENVYSCSGYPADCVLVGVGKICKENYPDLVVSGINHGANLGQDRYYSGTIAAAREAAFRGIPSIAVSLVTRSLKDVEHFDFAANYVRDLIKKGVKEHIPKMCLLNINVPNIPEEDITGVEVTFAGYQQYTEEVVERTDTRGRSYFWVGGTYQGPRDIPGSDGNAISAGKISVELQSLDHRIVEASQELMELIKRKE